jgi:hypothetical protein
MTNSTAPALVLDVHVCAARRSYTATFTGPRADALAVAFIEERSSTHAFAFVLCDGCSRDGRCDGTGQCAPGVLDAFPATFATLYPTCEHGMGGRLCMGPDHFMSAEQERALWG